MSRRLGCSHRVGSLFHALYLVQFSAVDRRTIEDLHKGGAPGYTTFKVSAQRMSTLQ